MGLSNQIPSSRLIQAGVCTSSTRPASPFEGQAIFETDTDRMLIWNGTAWVIPNAPAQNPTGLEFISETTFSGLGTPFINGCFSSIYTNYRVVMKLSTSTSTNIRMRFRFSTSTTDIAYVYDRYGFFIVGGALNNSTSIGENSYYFVSTTAGNTEIAPVALDIFGPNLAEKTVCQTQSWNTNSGALMFLNCRMNNTTQYTGFEITPDSGNLTGSIAVYGYRK